MRNFYMYMCDGCGFCREKPGICPFCKAELSYYVKKVQNVYQAEMEETVDEITKQREYAFQ